ncbi:hypothetical protein CBR_g586 [Chara braunii]|uniref:Protein kinase domain-containing protein n=1 Tax=Chara braunii TaxID=69332 RepID=A0A388KBP6_CHABU|nr:hypothetical protein CBR_g586 [Chara braunii]|eukprot:GBG67451.1 hypothetical protein CBR_g586 [Chara braunii]
MIAGHQQLVAPGTVWWAAAALISVFSISTMMFGCVSFGWRKKNRHVQEDDQPFPRLRKRAEITGQSDLEAGQQLRPQVSAKMGAYDPIRRGNRLLEGGRTSPALPRGTYLLKDSGGGGDRAKPHVIASRTAAAIDGLKRISKLELRYHDVIKATNNFDPKRLIGRGGFGSVYKGVLLNGRVVAVKRMDRGNHHLHSIRQMGGADRLLPDQLLSELEVLARVQSKHLVNLVGYAIGVGAGAGEDDAASAIAAAAGERKSELVLVYDYMPNGSLYGHLHGKHAGNNSLNWTTRLKIALDVAQGINYLHHICKPPIIHRDIKAGNVLLNKEFVACVADFGLSKLLGHTEIGPDGQAHVTDMSNDVKGTFGYVDPTYILTRQIAPKSDVYSYGILLLELLTGRKPLDQLTLPISDDEEDGPGRRVDARVGLAEWAVSRIAKEKVDEIMDPKLGRQYDKEVAQRVGELAVSCVNPDRELRPAMARVVAILSQLINSMSNPHNNSSGGARGEGAAAAAGEVGGGGAEEDAAGRKHQARGAAADGPPLAIMPPPPAAPPSPTSPAAGAKAPPAGLSAGAITSSPATKAAAAAAEAAEPRAAPAGAGEGSDEDPSADRMTGKVAVVVQSSDDGQAGPGAGGRDQRTSLTPVAVGVAHSVHPVHARKVFAVPTDTAGAGGGAATSAGASPRADVGAIGESRSSSVPAVAVKQHKDQGGERGGGSGGGDAIRRRSLDKTATTESSTVSHQRRSEDGGGGDCVVDRHYLEPSTTLSAAATAAAAGAGVAGGGGKPRRGGDPANQIEDKILAGSSSSLSTASTISSFSNDEEASYPAATATSAVRPREAAPQGLAGEDSSGSSDGESSGPYKNGKDRSHDEEGAGGGGGYLPSPSKEEGGQSTLKTHKLGHPTANDEADKPAKVSNPVLNPVSAEKQVPAQPQPPPQQQQDRVVNGEVMGNMVVGET